MNVTFKLGEHIAHKPLIDFKKMVKDKRLKILLFLILINIQEYNESWKSLLIVGIVAFFKLNIL
jgi:hypothetical protein